MNINDRLLKLTELSPLDKLILGLILDTPVALMNLHGGYYKTSDVIAKELGTTRTDVLKAIDSMKELDYVTSDVKADRQITNITKKLAALLFPLSEILLTVTDDDAVVDEENEDLSFLD